MFLYETVKPESKKFQFDRKRIVDIPYFLEQIQAATEHSKGFNLVLKFSFLTKKNKFGLWSKMFLKCTMCNVIIALETRRNEKDMQSFNINQVPLVQVALNSVLTKRTSCLPLWMYHLCRR